MLVDLWPLFGLIIRTPRLELRLPREEELAALASVASDGAFRPGEQPFLTPWGDGTPAGRARAVATGQWRSLAGWKPDRWELPLGVFAAGEPLGMVALMARDFPVVRQVTTWSWLGLGHHGKGYGTEARAGLLALAFDHLGATSARTDVFQDNHASQAVSRKLGYEPDGISIDARDGEAVISDRLRLTASGWSAVRSSIPVTVAGLEPCRPEFGLDLPLHRPPLG
ncbi:N-acetyltransferase [Actinoplanes sp. OR16]|uniref:GNAT family N-acetyltransferase n=1 Tax=Actinoplanes sp. OR16 TaxID=946334 RepID=UPI000F714068|nr:GNAT family N-acetyltransferase [Actinoplanes sp. OR16]BBH66315.1 N-acetyltransferase [Actinoplanes sp. OR16]